MLKIQSTALPPERMQNTVKEGGLWFEDHQKALLNEAKKITKKPKDQVKTFCFWFWKIVIIGVCIYLILTHIL